MFFVFMRFLSFDDGKQFEKKNEKNKINKKIKTNNAKKPFPQDSNLSNLNIIVKTAVAGEFAFEALSANDIYNKEIEFYNKIGPKIDEKLAKLNIKSELLPKSYGVCRANDAILFEDLKTKDYCISSIVRGFNFDEAKTVLKKAATFHAINAVLQEEEPDIFENFKYGKFFDDKKANFSMTRKPIL